MTRQQMKYYLENKGVHCPFCHSLDIALKPMQQDGEDAWQEVECVACGKGWCDHYKLIGISDLA